MNQQNSDGSWDDFEGGKVVRGTFVSLLCLEAISRSNLQKINRTRQRGIDWIISQQDDFGFWNETGLPYIFFTTIVLEYLQSKDSYPQIHDPYLSMAKSFLSNGSQFSAESDSNLQRLAITISFQGMEAFLYAILSHPSVNEKIFDKPGETIGMKKALTTFQGHLQKNKVLNSSQVIDYRNSLDRLAYLRDEVVHKGIDILPHTSQPLIEDALRFSSKYSLHVFGFDIWK